MGVSADEKITIIDSLEDLSIWAFDKCIQGELKHLLLNKDLQDITQEVKDEWQKLYTEFCDKTNNNSSLRMYLLVSEINHLENKFNIVPVLLSQMLKNKDLLIVSRYIEEVCLWGYTFDVENGLTKETDKILKTLSNEKTKYNRKLAEYEDLTKHKQEYLSIYQQKIKLETILKVSVDIKKCNVLEWIAYWEEVKVYLSKKNKSNG